MLFMRKTTALPSAAEALPGRAQEIPTASTHFVNGHQIKPPYPQGLEQAVFGLGCFWGAEQGVAGESARRPPPPVRSIMPRTIISNIWPRTRPAIADSAAPACPARSGRGFRPRPVAEWARGEGLAPPAYPLLTITDAKLERSRCEG